LSVERKPGNVQQRQKEEEKKKKQMKKGDILGFGFFFFWSLSSKEKHTQESVPTSNPFFFTGRNFFKK